VAQTTPGSTTTYEPLTAFWLTVTAAAVSWALTVAGAIAEITDGFPLGLVGLAAVLAGSITVGAMHQRAEHACQRRHAEVVEVAGALTAQVEQVSVKVGTRMTMTAEVAARLRQVDRPERRLESSEYYQVYTDVLMDLCGLRSDGEIEGEQPSASAN
jgi:hypothetical protein